MKCTNCGKITNKIEDYQNLSLEIKGVQSIEEALKKNMSGEIVSDYLCQGCEQKVDIEKRDLIT